MNAEEMAKLKDQVRINIDIVFACSMRRAYVVSFLDRKPLGRFLEFGYRRKEAQGVGGLQYILLLDFIQALANATFDQDPKSASLHNILKKLLRPEVRGEFLGLRAQSPVELIEVDIDSDSSEFLKQVLKERRLSHFEQTFDCIEATWTAITSDPNFEKIKHIRDKLVSHNEILTKSGMRTLFRLEEIGLDWRVPVTLCDTIERLAVDVYSVVTGSHYHLGNIVNFQNQMASDLADHLVEP